MGNFLIGETRGSIEKAINAYRNRLPEGQAVGVEESTSCHADLKIVDSITNRTLKIVELDINSAGVASFLEKI